MPHSKNCQKTMYACFIGYIVQAAAFPVLLLAGMLLLSRQKSVKS